MSALNRAQAELAECDKWDIPSSRPSTLIVSDLRALVRVVALDVSIAAHEQRQPNGSNDGAHRAWYDEMIRLRREHAAALAAATGDERAGRVDALVTAAEQMLRYVAGDHAIQMTDAVHDLAAALNRIKEVARGE